MSQDTSIDPMILDDGEGSRFELSIVGYQYPDRPEPWFMVHVRLETPGGNQEFTRPCLMDLDAKRLADWLANIGRNIFQMHRMEFAEPELKFECLGERGEDVSIRICISDAGPGSLLMPLDSWC